MKNVRLKLLLLASVAACAFLATPAFSQTAPQTTLEKFKPLRAPKPSRLVLKPNDRLAICGDSITEQRKYSRIMEDYLTMCVPELGVTVRQYGWGGERAPGFLARMTNDCLRFHPTIATTCYGMNDHEYRAYEPAVGQTYSNFTTAIVEAFKANGVRVILGSPGCVGKLPWWKKNTDTLDDLNLSLCHLRNIDIKLAAREKVGFADVFWPMLTSGVEAREKYGADYGIAGKDGVHPNWSGHAIMAYAFLKAFGLNGDLGTLTVDLKKNTLKTTAGHELLSANPGEFEIRSSRYPFCACVPTTNAPDSYPVCGKDASSSDNSIRSAMTLIPFNQDLNRLMLVVKHAKAPRYSVTWGEHTQSFDASQLAKGVNLAEAFPENPFSEAFAKVDTAIAIKQGFETHQIKDIFHGKGAEKNTDALEAKTEKERDLFVYAVKNAFVPVTHKLRITAE
jgi:lysophospholipase L1-like esterase